MQRGDVGRLQRIGGHHAELAHMAPARPVDLQKSRPTVRKILSCAERSRIGHRHRCGAARVGEEPSQRTDRRPDTGAVERERQRTAQVVPDRRTIRKTNGQALAEMIDCTQCVAVAPVLGADPCVTILCTWNRSEDAVQCSQRAGVDGACQCALRIFDLRSCRDRQLRCQLV